MWSDSNSCGCLWIILMLLALVCCCGGGMSRGSACGQGGCRRGVRNCDCD